MAPDKIKETLLKLADQVDRLAADLEKDAEKEAVRKTASAREEMGVGGLSRVPGKGSNPLVDFLLS